MTEPTELTAMQIATRKHRDAGMLLSGSRRRMEGGFRGCSVGCLAHELEPEWGPDEIADFGYARVADAYVDGQEWLVRLQDALFEELPAGEREQWHVQISDAIAARGRDWQAILHAVHAGILRIPYGTAGTASDAVQRVIDLHERAVRGEPVTDADWSAAAAAAWSAAAWSSADGAAWSAAQSAAWSAARSAVWSAESAAWSAERSARSAAAASTAAYREIRDVVLAEIVRAAR